MTTFAKPAPSPVGSAFPTLFQREKRPVMFGRDLVLLCTPPCSHPRVYDTCRVGAGLYVHATRVADVGRPQHKFRLESRSGHTNCYTAPTPSQNQPGPSRSIEACRRTVREC